MKELNYQIAQKTKINISFRYKLNWKEKSSESKSSHEQEQNVIERIR